MKRTLQREISGENVSRISTRADCQEKNGARQEHQVPLSTLGYWIRKQTRKPFELDLDLEPVFARLPSEPEIFSGKQPGSAPATISLPGNVRIEVSAFCPGKLMTALIHTLRAYA